MIPTWIIDSVERDRKQEQDRLAREDFNRKRVNLPDKQEQPQKPEPTSCVTIIYL